MSFVDKNRESYGVEPVCRMLPIATSLYYEHKAREKDPSRLPARAKRDRKLREEIRRVRKENFDVYGVRKVWRQLRREGSDVARCTVGRLMREMGLQGAVRGRRFKTTKPDPNGSRPVPKLGPFEIDRKDREACPNRRGQAGRDEDRGHRLDNLAREFRTQRIIFETARERLRPNAGELASAGRK